MNSKLPEGAYTVRIDCVDMETTSLHGEAITAYSMTVTSGPCEGTRISVSQTLPPPSTEDMNMNEQGDPIPEVTEQEILQEMITLGGHFVSHLARAWQYADEQNQARLRAAFPEYLQIYKNLAIATKELSRKKPK